MQAIEALGEILKPDEISYALKYALKGCELADARSCANAAKYEYLQIFNDIEHLEKQAFKLARRGCEQKDAKSCVLLGEFYLNGLKHAGLKPNLKKAAQLINQNCDGEECMMFEDVGMFLADFNDCASGHLDTCKGFIASFERSEFDDPYLLRAQGISCSLGDKNECKKLKEK